MQVSDILDRYTILKIKKENGLDVEEELKVYEKEIFEKDYGNTFGLYEVNKLIWEKMDEFIGESKDLAVIGKLSLEVEALNLVRNKIRNAITKHYDAGYNEPKRYKKVRTNLS